MLKCLMDTDGDVGDGVLKERGAWRKRSSDDINSRCATNVHVLSLKLSVVSLKPITVSRLFASAVGREERIF